MAITFSHDAHAQGASIIPPHKDRWRVFQGLSLSYRKEKEKNVIRRGVTRQSVPRLCFLEWLKEISSNLLRRNNGPASRHSWRGFVQFAPGAVSSLPPFSPPHFAASSCFFFSPFLAKTTNKTSQVGFFPLFFLFLFGMITPLLLFFFSFQVRM